MYLLIFVCISVFLVHMPALSARAIFHDDHMYVTNNALVKNPSWASARRFFAEVLKPSTVKGYYQPLTMISLMIDSGLAGRTNSFRTFHRTSLLLHVTNTALVAVLLYLLFGQALVAAGVGLLFGLHPMTVDSICWLSERKTLLATFFALSSIILYVRFARLGKKRYFIGCFVAYVLALLAKPITVPLPAMMLLMDYWPLKRIRWKVVIEKLPLFAVGTLFAVITCISQSRSGNVRLPGQHNLLDVMLILCHNTVFYLYKIVWPVNLSAYYGYSTYRMVLTGIVGMCILIPLLVISLRWTRALITCWLMFFLAILPTMGIIGVTPVIAANRYTYLPILGLLILIASFLAWFQTFSCRRKTIAGCAPVMVVLLTLAGAEAVAARGYQYYWRDTVLLYEHMLTICPRSAMLHSDLGVVLSWQNKTDEAISQFRQALKIAPRFALAHFNLATELRRLNDKIDEATCHYRKALEIDPFYTEARLNLGLILKSKGQYEEAIKQFRKVLQTNPELVGAHYNLGMALILGGWPDKGLRSLREAVRLSPASLIYLKELAWFLSTHPDPEVRDADKSLRLAERASELTMNRNPEILDTLAAAYAARGQFSLAVSLAERALTFADRTRNKEFTMQISERLELYKHRKQYIQNPREQIKQFLPAVSEDKSETENENIEEVSL